MKKVLFVVFLMSVLTLNAQETKWDATIASQVDEQIWEPFKQSYASGDYETFNSLHTDEVMRISPRGIRIGEEYRESNERSFQKPNRTPRTIDFRFEHRIYAGTMGYEVGYYKMVTKKPGQDPEHHYARFSVVLHKVDGTWKIAQDWDIDTINGVDVTEDDFNRLDN